MMRALSLAVISAFALAIPAMAEDAAMKPSTTEASPAARGALFTQDQARSHLARLGYTNVSELAKDENGTWLGSATKDGKTVPVAVNVNAGASATN